MKGMARFNAGRARRVAGVGRQKNIGSEGSVSVQYDGEGCFLWTETGWYVNARIKEGYGSHLPRVG